MINMTIDARFRVVAQARPDYTALVCGESRLTYAELDRRSDSVAHFLRGLGVGHGQRIGLYVQRSIDAIATILGIIKCGAAYVPFDPAYPPALLKFVYSDCAPSVMLVQAELLPPGAAPFWSGEVHDLRAATAISAQDPAFAARVGDPQDAAYVMYTSGSTGHPKGVVVPHRGVVRLVDNSFAQMDAQQVHLQMAPLAFDASTFEIWGALLHGAVLAILPTTYPSLDDIAAAIARHGVTTAWLTAGLFHLMVEHRVSGLAPLRQLLAGGDVLSPSHVAKAQAALPDCQLINGYGPTENTTFTCCYRIPRLDSPLGGAALPAIPIGMPIDHTQVYILDDNGKPAEEGELYAGGAGLALGYLNRDELTAERFIANPFHARGLDKLYRTGDRVRRRADGNIDFLGRIDRQVKINGKRVELAEVEAVMRRSGVVEDAVAIAPEPAAGARKIHAFVTVRQPGPDTVNLLRDFLKHNCPDYMVPATFTVLDVMPLSPIGKIDRSKLPSPLQAATSPQVPVAASSAIEQQLLAIWRQVLGSETVGLNDNFFDLGGTSLQLIAVHATITTTFRSDVSVVDLFQYPRISALAQRISGSREARGGTLKSDERARHAQAALELARTRAAARRTVR